jgi:hypothetical protein
MRFIPLEEAGGPAEPEPTANPGLTFTPLQPALVDPRQYNVGNLREVGGPKFRSFSTPEEGVAANAQNLLAYDKRGINTVSKIISTWAPKSDKNPTEAYIANVSKALGVDPNTPLNMQDPAVMSKLIAAIGVQEKGQKTFGSTFTPESINAGVGIALGKGAKPLTFTPLEVAEQAPVEEPQKPVPAIQAKMTPERWGNIGGRGNPDKKPESVMSGYVAGQKREEPLPIGVERDITDPLIKMVEARLGSLPKEERDKALAGMAQRNDVYGRAAKVIQGKYQALDKVTSPATAQAFDPRLEAQAGKLAVQGNMDPQAAKFFAQRDLRRGMMPNPLPLAVPDVDAEQAALEGERVRKEMEGAGFGERVGAEMGTRLRQTSIGAARVYADLAGDKGLQRDLNSWQKLESARGEAIPKGDSIAERSAQQAIATLGGQAPMMILGAMTGTAMPVLAQVGFETFMQNYGQGRSSNLSPAEASTRAGLMAVSELVFERYGLGDQLKAIRGVIDRVPTKDLSGYLAASLIKELPAEQATTLSQFMVDKLPQIGLGQNAGFKDYLEQAGETLRQTVIQTGSTNAAIYGASKAERTYSEKVLPAISRDRAIARAIDKGPSGTEPTIAALRGSSTLERPGSIPKPPEAPVSTRPPATPTPTAPATLEAPATPATAAPATPQAPSAPEVVPGMPTGEEIEEVSVTPVTQTPSQEQKPATDLPFTPIGKGPQFKGSVAPTQAAARLPDTPTVAPVEPVKAFEPTAPQHRDAELPTTDVPIKSLKLSQDVPQFKYGANTKGVVKPLGGKFSREGLAPIAVWERLDGSLEVISGRHRFDLAQRSGEETIPAQVYYESKGFTAKDAAIKDAELNVRDDQGQVKDYVNYFKESGMDRQTAESKGFLARDKGKRGFTIGNQGSDELIESLRADQISDEAAFYIALNAPNDAKLQTVGMKAVKDGKSVNMATNMMQAVKTLAGRKGVNIDMFGDDQQAILDAEEMAAFAGKKQREIQNRLSAISGASKRPEIAKSEGIDVNNLELVKDRVKELTRLKAKWDKWAENSEAISEINQALNMSGFELTSESESERQAREDKEAAEKEGKERKEIADREVDMFALTPSPAPEQETPPTEDLFAAKEPVKAEEPAKKPRAKKPKAEPKVAVGKVVFEQSFNDNFAFKIFKTAEGYSAGTYSKKLKAYLQDNNKGLLGLGVQNIKNEDIDDELKEVNEAAKGWDALSKEEKASFIKELTDSEQSQEDASQKPVNKQEANKPDEEDSGFRGASDKEVADVAKAFDKAQEAAADESVTRVFDAPNKTEVVRLEEKTRIYVKDAGYMTVAQAKERIAEWKRHASAQAKSRKNANKVVLSLFDKTGQWSEPWEEAGYEVYRFDIQTDQMFGDVNKFSTEFFNDIFGSFGGNDVYAILAACPCTDFASSGARHFAAKDASGQTIKAVQLVQQTLATIEYFKPSVWAIENPVGRIEKLTGLPPWRLSFNPNHLGDPYTKKTLLWGRFNAGLPIAPVEPTEGSKMHTMYGGKSEATKNARSVTPEGFAYSFFMANNAIDHPVMALANKYDMMDRDVFQKAIDAGMSEGDISNIVDDFYYFSLKYKEAEQALNDRVLEIGALEDNKVSVPENVKVKDSVREVLLSDGMLVRVFKTSDGYGSGLYDVDSGNYVDDSIVRYKGNDALGKANKKADDMVKADMPQEKGAEPELEAQAINKNVHEQVNKMLDDFMVGDFVRMSNVPGVVIGIDGDYVRFRPDAARSPKAYQRVAKKTLTFVARPDTTSETAYSKDQDSKFGEEAGSLNANMGNLIQLLGANMYAANVADVALKELLQNAFDAVKGAVSSKKAPSLYKSGSIEISINQTDRTISIKDNARGMTAEIVREAFFTVAGTNKSDLDPSERSGGLGLAKMGFMLGSKRLQLDTVRDGVRITVDTSSSDIANSKFKINKSPAPKKEHGTTVTVTIPETYTDPKTGDEKDIWFPWGLESVAPLNKPLIGPVEVKVNYTSFGGTESKALPVGTNFPLNKYTKFKANFEWGAADIYFSIERNNASNPYYISHQVLSSGVYQFSPDFKLNNEKIPYDIIVDVKPNIEARHPDYPFENSRERFKGRLGKDIASLTAYLGAIARGYEASNLQTVFKDIVSMPRVEAGQDIANLAGKLQKSFDKGEERKPVELKPLPKEVTITDMGVEDTKTKQTLVETKQKEEEKQKESTFKGEAAPKSSDFLIEMKQDTKLPIYHNNTSVDYLKIGEEYGEPMKFLAELGTLMVEMKEELAASGMYGYDVLAPENLFFAGIAIDKQYGGVHIKVPYKAVLLNPFYSFGAKTLFGVREQLLDTMIHEIAHTGSMDHGVAHNSQMIKVKQYLADEALYDYYRDALMDILSRHESTFTAMRDAYGQSTTRNIAKSLEDYGKGSAAASSRGDRDVDQDAPGSVPSGEGPDGGEDLRGAGATGNAGKVRGGSGETRGEEEQGLMDKYSRPHTPMLDNTPLKTFLTKAYSNGKELITEAVTHPIQTSVAAERAVTDGLLSARNKTIWYGAGLESRDFARYNGEMRTAGDAVVASVALDNAIRSGNIGVEVIFKGGLKYDAKAGNFVAVDSKLGMRGVYEAEAALKKRLGDQLGTDIVQGYLEAKRSISIMNELAERGAALEDATQNLEAMKALKMPAEEIAQAQALVNDLTLDLEAINKAVTSVNMSDEEMEEFAALDAKHPELRKLMDNWTAINQNLLKVWRQVGLLSQSRYDTLSAIKDYVPWYRIMNDEDVHSAGQTVQSTTRSMTNIGREKLFKRGRPMNVVDFRATAGQQDFTIAPTSVIKVKVNGKKVSPDLITATPDGKVHIDMALQENDLVVFETNREIQNIVDNMTRNVMRMTMNGIRQFAANRIVLEYASRNASDKVMIFPSVDPSQGRFEWMVNGKKVVVEIKDPLVAASIYGMENINLKMWKPLAAVANIVRRSITLSGVFQVKQVFKDAPTAALVTGVRNPLALIGGVWKSFLTSLLHPVGKKAGINLDPTIDILKAAGIGGFQSPARTPEAEIKRRLGIMNRNVYSAVIKGLDHIGDSSDMAQRAAVYNRVMAETGDQTQALYQAANVINFMHHGSSGFAQAAVKLVPFIGAWSNSIDVLVNSLMGGGLKGMSRRKALARLAVAGSMLSMMTLLYCMLAGGDPDYDELDDQTKLRNIIIPGTKIVLPMNTSAAFFFKAIPELIYNKVTRDGTDNENDARRLRRALAEVARDSLLGPEPIPAGIKPVLEVMINHSFFTGRPVVPESIKDVEAAEQYVASTSELGKKISALLAIPGTDGKRVINPVEADHLVRGLFGTTGAMAQWVANSIEASNRPAQTEREKPFTGSFKRDEVPRGNEDLFYDFKDIVMEKYKTLQKLAEREDFDAVDKYLDKNGDVAGMYEYITEAEQDLKELNAEIRRLGESRDTGMTPKERREEIIELQRLRNEVLSPVKELRREVLVK